MKAPHRMGLVFWPAFDWFITPTHPEREERLLFTRDQIMEEGLLDITGIQELKPRLATNRDIERVHIPVPDLAHLITEAHYISAGGAIRAAEAYMNGEVERSFALVRPPGHHAMRVVHGTRGFCTVNIESIMIEYLRQHYGIRRVAIVDTDVHHGDGTQDVFYHDPDVLYISFHQDGRTLYPGSGFINELGGPNAYCSNICIPLPPGTGDEGLLKVLHELILPILHDFHPELIVNSAGQDNHYSDPLANMAISAQGYAKLTEQLKAHIAVLEGGYSIERALPYVNVGIILAMAGMDYSGVVEPGYDAATLRQSPKICDYIDKEIHDIHEIWTNRERLKRMELQETGEWFNREKRIYYDDDGIEERQLETVKMCNHCPGYMKIETSASGGVNQNAYAVIIPRYACPHCVQGAKDVYMRVRRQQRYQHLYLQDKTSDELIR